MKNLTLFTVFLALSTISLGQGFYWAKGSGSTGNDIAKSVFVDGAGGVYVVGSFEGTVDFDPGPAVLNMTSAGGSDIFIQKFNSSGTLLFARRIGGGGNDSANDVAVDPNSNIYITGSFFATVDFDPGAGVSNLVSAGGLDIFILRLTSAGNWSYSARMGGTTNDEGLTVCANSGAYAVGGTFLGNNIDFDPGAGVANLSSSGITAGFMARYTVGTSFTFAQLMGGSATASEMDGSGNVYTTGVLGPIINVGGTTVSSLGGIDIYVSKMTAAGANVWAKAMGSSAGEGGYAIAVDASSNVYTSGFFSGTADFDPGPGSAPLASGGSNDIFVSKLDASGNYAWARSFPGTGDDRGIGIDTDADGNVYTVGYFRNTVDFDPGPGAANITSAGIVDGFVSKLDAAGNYVWAQSIASASSEAIYNVQLDNASNIHFCGYYSSTCDFDPTGASANMTSAGVLDAQVTKWAPCAVAIAPTNTTPPANLSICGLSGSTTLSGSGSGTLGWYSAASGGTYLGAGSTLVTGVINGTTTFYLQDSTCAAGPRTAITVSLTDYPPAPTITAVGPTTFCAGGSVNLTSTVGSSYLWSNGATSSSINVTSAGSYSVQVTNAAGCQSVASSGTTVTVNTLPFTPTISAGGPTTFCTGGSVTLTSTAGSSYLWSNGATSSSINVTTAGTYTVQVTNAAGCQSVASAGTTVIVGTLPAQPTISAGGPTTFCAGGSVTLTSSAGTSYLWSTGATTASISPTTAGTYTVQVTNASGCQSIASAGTAVTVNAAPTQPTISAGGPTSFCTGGSVTLTASAGTSYLWSNGATTASISPTTAGTYTVQVTNAAGCQSILSAGTSVTVNTLPSQPTISAGGLTTFCAGGSVTLTASAGSSYLWSNGATTASISATTAGTYTVQVTNASGCQSIASLGTTVTVNALPAQPTIAAGGPTTFCAGGSVTLTASAGTSYFWSNGASTTSISPSTAGMYTVQVTNAFGCLSIASAGTTITVNALPSQPTITAGGPTTFCTGGSVTLTSSAGSGYLWSDGSMSPSINVSSTSTYTVQVTNAAGCQSVASASIVVTENTLPNAPIISPNAPTTFCDGGTVNLASSAGITYLWSNGATTAAIDLTTGGTFTVQVTGPNGCQSPSSAPMIVTVNAVPVISQGTISNPTSCTIDNGSIQINGSGTGTLSWSGTTSGSLNGVTLPTTIPSLGDGSYSITFTNASSCVSNTENVSLSAPSAPAAPSISAAGSTTFCDGGSVTLTASTGSTYLWSNGATSASIVVNTADNYTVSITDASGCSSPASAATSVTVNALPVISTGAIVNPASCLIDDGSIEISGSETGDLSWSGQASGNLTGVTLPTTISNLGAGSYDFTFTNALGCVSLSLNAILAAPSTPATPTITASGPLAFCDGGFVTLSAPSATSYLWSNGETTQDILVDANGSFSVVITNADGCSSLSSLTTTVTEDLMPNLGVSVLDNVITANEAGVNYQWIDCGNANQPIAGATNQSFTPTANGNYAVIITQGACSDTSVCSAITTIGIDEIKSALFVHVFPNPTTKNLTIELNSTIESIAIYAMTGELVQTENSTAFSVEQLSRGMYLVEIKTQIGIGTARFVKE